jgi:hypothetical protein
MFAARSGLEVASAARSGQMRANSFTLVPAAALTHAAILETPEARLFETIICKVYNLYCSQSWANTLNSCTHTALQCLLYSVCSAHSNPQACMSHRDYRHFQKLKFLSRTNSSWLLELHIANLHLLGCCSCSIKLLGAQVLSGSEQSQREIWSATAASQAVRRQAWAPRPRWAVPAAVRHAAAALRAPAAHRPLSVLDVNLGFDGSAALIQSVAKHAYTSDH